MSPFDMGREQEEYIVRALEEMHDSGRSGPFLLSDVKERAVSTARNEGHDVQIAYNDRMLRDSARLSDEGRVILTKIDRRYYLALPNTDIPSTAIFIGRHDIPEYKTHNLDKLPEDERKILERNKKINKMLDRDAYPIAKAKTDQLENDIANKYGGFWNSPVEEQQKFYRDVDKIHAAVRKELRKKYSEEFE